MVKQNENENAAWQKKWQDEWVASANHMKIMLAALPENEGFARVAVAAFMTQLNPMLEDVDDVKTAVSEAVTNSIIHGYENRYDKSPEIELAVFLTERAIHIKVKDEGVGIDNIMQAMEPLFTTKPELERSGMGFAFMEAFMDELHVESAPGEGCCVYMSKQIGGQ